MMPAFAGASEPFSLFSPPFCALCEYQGLSVACDLRELNSLQLCEKIIITRRRGMSTFDTDLVFETPGKGWSLMFRSIHSKFRRTWGESDLIENSCQELHLIIQYYIAVRPETSSRQCTESNNNS